ncbi:hypothetical protein EON65_46580 [archaeon]|nr:MAG: hypothetical protein EON65_46580 [archaeon]
MKRLLDRTRELGHYKGLEMIEEGKFDTVDIEHEQVRPTHYLAWKQVSKTAVWKGKDYQILTDCSGIVKSGEMAAVMGLSGKLECVASPKHSWLTTFV